MVSSVLREVRAQVLVLESVLTHRPLPGMDRALAFPDPIQGEDDVQVVLVDGNDVIQHVSPETLDPVVRQNSKRL